MKKIQEVEKAKALLKEAIDWSLFKWLWEKNAVREAGDKADAALDRLNKKIKAQWSDDVREGYRFLAHSNQNGKGRKHRELDAPSSLGIDPELLQVIRQVKEIDDKAHSARVDARQTFDQAERQLNTDLAREGCKKAIHSWNLHEKAIREAEALVEMNSEMANKCQAAD
jgi:hypothetical protein